MSNSNKYAFDIQVAANTYSGELAMPYVGAATLGAESIAKGRMRLIEGVTRKAVVNPIAVADPIVASSCSTTDGANITVNEQVATLSDLMVSEQVCRKTIFPTYIAAQNRMNRDGELPPAFSDFLLLYTAQRAGEHLEKLMFQGDSGAVFGTGFLSTDGVIDDHATGIKGGACKDFAEADLNTAFTKASILGHMDSVFETAAATPAILDKPGCGFYVSYEAYAFFQQAIADKGTEGNYNKDLKSVTYLGYPVYPTAGIPNAKDGMIFTYPDNLVVATNNFTADTEAQLIPRYQYDGSDNVQVTMRFAVGVQTAVATDGVVGFNFS